MSQFFKLPTPADPHGRKVPGVWLNPIFFRFVADHSKDARLDDIELLPASIWTSILPKDQTLYSLNLVDLNASESPADLGRIVRTRKGTLHANPALLAAVIDHKLSETKPGGHEATNLYFAGDKVTKFGELKIFTVDGPPQQVAETLKLSLPES